MRNLLPILGLLACDSLPERLVDCKDVACQQRWVAARWEDDRDLLARSLRYVDDPIVQATLVRQLTLAHPGETTALCEALANETEKLACINRNRRPHLKNLEATADTPGLRLSVPLPSPWASVSPRPVACAAEPRVCQFEAALERASAGDAAGAAAACVALPEPIVASECFFQAAEAVAHREGPPNAATVSLCIGSGSYTALCLRHVVKDIGAAAPVADSGTSIEWKAYHAALIESTAMLSGDPGLAAAFGSQAWAYALRFSYARSKDLTGLPLALLPPEAAPHVRGAAAFHLWHREGTSDRDLPAWQARLAEVLGDHAPRAPYAVAGLSAGDRVLKAFWGTSLPREKALPRVAWLGENERALASDPANDALVCLLESIALGHPSGEHLLEAALDHPSGLVRWTAARLLGGLDPTNRRLRRHEDADALVQERVDLVTPGR